MGITQRGAFDRRVNLRRRNIGVTEHFLNRTQVRTAREQVRRKGVT